MSGPLEHRDVRLAVGADPGHLSSEVEAHLTTCAECRRFRDETLALDGRLRAALELPLPEFRRRAPPARRFALAASVIVALVVAGGAWLFRPPSALAGEVVEHVLHEPGSWDAPEKVARVSIEDVLKTAGVEFDSQVPVVYAASCTFRGRRTAHLVVKTDNGPMTVMLLPHIPVKQRESFTESGIEGVLLPSGAGSVAVLSRGGAVDTAAAEAMVSGVRWAR